MVTRKKAGTTEETTGTQQRSTNRLKLRLDDMITVSPKTPQQKNFFDAYRNGDYFMCLHGVAGTGKTYIAMYRALEEVMDKSNPYEQLVIIRSAVQSRDMGHLPGDVDDKMDIYIQPYRQVATDLFRRSDAWQRLYEQGHVEFMSTSFIRGTTFTNSILLVDEFQNMSFEELDTIITRVGHTSKIIFCGDLRQTDLKKSNDKTGLPKFLAIAEKMSSFSRFEFTINDIVRSSLVKDYIIAKTKYEDES